MFRDIKELKTTNRVTEILTTEGGRIRDFTEIQQIFENKYKTLTKNNNRRETAVEEHIEVSTTDDHITQEQQIDTKFTHEKN